MSTASRVLSSGERSGLMRTGPLNELILDKAKEASPDQRKVIKIGLGLVAASLNFPSL